MKRECDVCGVEEDEYWMTSFNVGARTKWLCPECYKNSQRELTMSDIHRKHKLYKIAENKKVKK